MTFQSFEHLIALEMYGKEKNIYAACSDTTTGKQEGLCHSFRVVLQPFIWVLDKE